MVRSSIGRRAKGKRLERATYGIVELLERRILMSIQVTNDFDVASMATTDTHYTGSLRAAIDNINSAGSGTITFASTLTGTTGNTIHLSHGPLELQRHSAYIDGPGITIDGDSGTAIFKNDFAAALKIKGLDIQNAHSSNKGGGIDNLGTLNLVQVNISNSYSTQQGGGIYNSGDIGILDHCDIDGDSSQGNGGGIYNASSIGPINNCKVDFDSTTTVNSFIGDGGGINNIGTITKIGGDENRSQLKFAAASAMYR